MSEASRIPKPGRSWIVRAARSLVLRTYALLLIVLIGWVSWRAFRYLVVSLLLPEGAPPQLTALPKRLDTPLLTTYRDEWQGLQSAEHARSPLAHYHRLESWIQPDAGNNCTTSGCHSPLPHAKRKEVRAFLNMHATSMHCGVCHMATEDRPLPLTWYNIRNGQESAPPAVLRALAELQAIRSADGNWGGTVEQRRTITALLHAAAEETGGAPELVTMARHFSSIRLAGPAFAELAAAALEILPRHFRGEYGAKTALFDRATGAPLLGHPGTAEAIQRFHRESPSASPAEREALLTAVHPRRRDVALVCGDCHQREGGLIDFAALGYPEPRIDDLVRPVVFQMIEHIAKGQPFYLPQFVSPGETPPKPPPEREQTP